MNKTPSDPTQNSEDELLTEYDFNYQKVKPNRFAARNEEQKLTVVVLDEDDEFEAIADRLGDEFQGYVGDAAPVLSDHAVSRAGIYEEHP